MQNLRKRIATELPPLTVETLSDCWHAIYQLRHAASLIFSQVDFILAPVAACPPPIHGTSSFTVDAQTLQSQEVFQFSSAVNALGLPALSFPTRSAKNKLPLGLQVIGPRFSEFQLCSLLRATGYTESIATHP